MKSLALQTCCSNANAILNEEAYQTWIALVDVSSICKCLSTFLHFPFPTCSPQLLLLWIIHLAASCSLRRPMIQPCKSTKQENNQTTRVSEPIQSAKVNKINGMASNETEIIFIFVPSNKANKPNSTRQTHDPQSKQRKKIKMENKQSAVAVPFSILRAACPDEEQQSGEKSNIQSHLRIYWLTLCVAVRVNDG